MVIVLITTVTVNYMGSNTCYNGTMKFEKSKPNEIQDGFAKVVGFPGYFVKKKPVLDKLSAQKLRLLAEAKKKLRMEFWIRVKKGIGQFFIVLFVLAVIFSMIVVPLLIVFG